MALYRSKQQFRIEEHTSMGNVSIHVIGVLDNMTYAVVTPEDFDKNFELIPEETPTEE